MDQTRREFVRIAGLALIGACAGCAGGTDTGNGDTGGSDTDGADTDVAGGGDTSVPAGWTALSLASNPKLANVGGFVYRNLGGSRLIVARLDDTPTFVALSAACTHQGCDVSYQKGDDRFYCACHGSAFADDGQVLQGPARRALKAYDTQWDEANERVLVRTG